MSSDINKIRSNSEETVSVGEKLGYEKDSKEKMPWEHYLEAYRNMDPQETAERLQIPYDETKRPFVFRFWVPYMKFPGRTFM